LHNFDEELHNSYDLDLSWQEAVDLQPEGENEEEQKSINSPTKTAIFTCTSSRRRSLFLTSMLSMAR
jgi:hypothetical protein